MMKALFTWVSIAALVFTSSCSKHQGCGSPAGLKIFNINYFSAYPSWDTLPGAKSYIVQYRKVGTTAWTKSAEMTANWTEIFPLDSATSYECQVCAQCSNGTSEYSSSNIFNTGNPVGFWIFKGSPTLGAFATTDTSKKTLTITDGMAVPNNYNFLSFTFSSYPMVSGTYKVVSPSAGVTGNTIIIGLYGTYHSTGNDNVSVNVQVTNGKINFSIPSVEVADGTLTSIISNIKVNQ